MKEYFADNSQNDGNFDDNSSYPKYEKTFTPLKGRNKCLDVCCDLLKSLNENMENMDAKCQKTNLLPKHWDAIDSLKNNKSIVIKQADKGGSFCILDTDHYISMIHKILEIDTTHIFGMPRKYFKLKENIDSNIVEEIKKLLDKYPSVLDEKQRKYLYDFQWHTANFYGLPKCHKSEFINKSILDQKKEIIHCCRPMDLKLRPIVGGWAHPTSRLSNLIDAILQPLLVMVPSFLKDEDSFIQKLDRASIEENDGIFVTFDISDMFSNIHLKNALKAIKYYFDKYQNLINPIFTWDFIKDVISFIFRNNTFFFNGCYFKQAQGMAMGTKMACVVADLSVGFLEETNLYPNLKQDFSEEYSIFVQNFLKRFRDDLFNFHHNKYGSPTQLLHYLNNMDPNLKFTMELNENSCNYLSMNISKIEGRLMLDIFYKDTNSHNYLHYSSCHSWSVKKSIPGNLALRILKRVNSEDRKTVRLNELCLHLKNRGYPEEIIQWGFEWAQNHTSGNSLGNTNIGKINFVHDFNPRDVDVKFFILKIFDILKMDTRMNKILMNCRIQESFRQSLSLKNILCPSKFDESPKILPGSFKCKGKRCDICNLIVECQFHQFENGKTHKITTHLNCNSTYVIYAIICQNCPRTYIGECKNLRTRTNLAINQIKHERYRKLDVSHHIFTCGKGNFKLIPFFQSKDILIERKTMELYFINKYESSLNTENN